MILVSEWANLFHKEISATIHQRSAHMSEARDLLYWNSINHHDRSINDAGRYQEVFEGEALHHLNFSLRLHK
jgi:hypothetical protein